MNRLTRTFRSLLGGLLVIALTIPSNSYASTPKTQSNGPSDPHEVENFMDEFFRRADVQSMLAGAVVAVVGEDKVQLSKGYGYANLNERSLIDPDRTLFRVASISKTITATAVMQLAEQGKVDLDADVSRYMAGVSIPNRTGTPLTLKHLLTHTSGFDYTDGTEDEGDPSEAPLPLESFVKEQLPTVVRKPGEAFRYDNYGYDVLGYVVQTVTGKPFENVVANEIFTPLGMVNSSFALTPDVQSRMATPYDREGNPIPQYVTIPSILPDGGMISTGADMAKFMLAQLNGGKAIRSGSSILNATAINAMQRLSVSIHPGIPGVGYGFESSFPSLNNGQYVVDKSGVSSGFQSHMWLLPDRKVGLFVALNSTRDARKLRTALIQAFMDHYYPKPTETETVTPIHLKRQQLQRFEGEYSDLRMKFLHYGITAHDDGLTVNDSNGEHELIPIEPLLFRDEEGKLAGFKEDGTGNIAYFSYSKADSWSERLPERKLYADVPDNHPYAKFIYYAQQQSLLGKEEEPAFRPEVPITRAEFVGQLMTLAGDPLSNEPSLFVDTNNHRYASEIQTALEYGIIKGTPGGRFEPNRPMTRQEAAMALTRAFLIGLGSAGAVPLEAELKGDTNAWAIKGVENVVARGYFGPEVVKDVEGKVDYHSKQPMLRQEAAAMFYRFP